MRKDCTEANSPPDLHKSALTIFWIEKYIENATRGGEGMFALLIVFYTNATLSVGNLLL